VSKSRPAVQRRDDVFISDDLVDTRSQNEKKRRFPGGQPFSSPAPDDAQEAEIDDDAVGGDPRRMRVGGLAHVALESGSSARELR
jgi:hypothetical protein